MAEVLVLGIGNPLRGDDGVGWRAASELASQLTGCSAETLPCHQLTPELAERLAGLRRVIFVDAAVGPQAGRTRCQTVQADSTANSTFSHHLSPSCLLGYAQELFGVCPEAVQVTVTGQSFDYAERFSAPVDAAFPQLLQTVQMLATADRPTPGVAMNSNGIDSR